MEILQDHGRHTRLSFLQLQPDSRPALAELGVATDVRFVTQRVPSEVRSQSQSQSRQQGRRKIFGAQFLPSFFLSSWFGLSIFFDFITLT